MVTTVAFAMALVRFGVGRGGGFLLTILGLAIVGVVAWELMRPDSKDQTKN
jgi:hypothetical protein